MCQIAERVCTFRSLIDRGRGIVGGRRGGGRSGWKKYQKGGEGSRKGKILIGEGWLYIAFFFPFLTIKNTIFRTFVYTVTLKKKQN